MNGMSQETRTGCLERTRAGGRPLDGGRTVHYYDVRGAIDSTNPSVGLLMFQMRTRVNLLEMRFVIGASQYWV